jgi:hypothetical protein
MDYLIYTSGTIGDCIFGRKNRDLKNFRTSSVRITTTMASLASRSTTQALRAVSRRAPRALAKAVRPTQAASYSLFAKAAVARCSQESTVLVSSPP